MAMPKAPPAVTPLTGDEIIRLIQSGKLVLARTSDLKGLKGDKGDKGDAGAASTVPGPKGDKGDAGAASTVPGPKGDTGPAGAPARVETYTATSNGSAIATFVFTPAFTTILDIRVRPSWNGNQVIDGGEASRSLTGCTVLAKRSKGTLLASDQPFENAPNTSITIIVIGR